MLALIMFAIIGFAIDPPNIYWFMFVAYCVIKLIELLFKFLKACMED